MLPHSNQMIMRYPVDYLGHIYSGMGGISSAKSAHYGDYLGPSTVADSYITNADNGKMTYPSAINGVMPMESVTMSALTEAMQSWTNALCNTVYTDKKEISMKRTVFNDSPAEPTPSGSRASDVSNRSEGKSFQLVRRSKGASITSDYVGTEYGRKIWDVSLQQLARSHVISDQLLACGCILSIQEVPVFMRYDKNQSQDVTLKNIFRHSIRTWNVLSKMNGFSVMIDIAKEVVTERNGIIDTVLISKTARKHSSLSKYNSIHELSGPAKNGLRNMYNDFESEVFLDGVKTLTIEPFKYNMSNRRNADPLKGKVQIGEYWTAGGLDSIPTSGPYFSLVNSGVTIYSSEGGSEHVTISMREALINCGLFDDNGIYQTNGMSTDDLKNDPFCDDKGNTFKTLGDFFKRHGADESIKKYIEYVTKKILVAPISKLEDLFKKLMPFGIAKTKKGVSVITNTTNKTDGDNIVKDVLADIGGGTGNYEPHESFDDLPFHLRTFLALYDADIPLPFGMLYMRGQATYSSIATSFAKKKNSITIYKSSPKFAVNHNADTSLFSAQFSMHSGVYVTQPENLLCMPNTSIVDSLSGCGHQLYNANKDTYHYRPSQHKYGIDNSKSIHAIPIMLSEVSTLMASMDMTGEFEIGFPSVNGGKKHYSTAVRFSSIWRLNPQEHLSQGSRSCTPFITSYIPRTLSLFNSVVHVAWCKKFDGQTNTQKEYSGSAHWGAEDNQIGSRSIRTGLQVRTY